MDALSSGFAPSSLDLRSVENYLFRVPRYQDRKPSPTCSNSHREKGSTEGSSAENHNRVMVIS